MYSKKDCRSKFSIVIYSNSSPFNNDLEHIMGVNITYKNIEKITPTPTIKNAITGQTNSMTIPKPQQR
jgi:hypothetical protein